MVCNGLFAHSTQNLNLCSSSDFPASSLDALNAELRAANFEPYVTAVGGSGLGVLSPYDHSQGVERPVPFRGPITPPETPSELSNDVDTRSLREQFSTISEAQLGEWADGQGRWLFV